MHGEQSGWVAFILENEVFSEINECNNKIYLLNVLYVTQKLHKKFCDEETSNKKQTLYLIKKWMVSAQKAL